MTDAPVALVTGASRGIGKASAIALASAGFDVAITARTVHEGDGRSEPNSVRGDDPVVSLPGSLESTADEIASRGRRALIVPMDLLDVTSVEAAPLTVLGEWGRIDVLFNNAIYQGRGTMDRILGMRLEDIDKVKAAFGRVAGGIEAEFADQGVRAFNVDPGNVITEKRRLQHPNDDYERGFGSAPAEATGAVVGWLAGNDEALRFAGKWIYAPKLCADRGLLPGWPPEGVTP